jgi:hypothetical protein
VECVALVGKLCRRCGWLHYQWGLTGLRPEQVPLKWSQLPGSALLCNETEEGHTLLGVIGRFERLVLSTLCVNLLTRLLAAVTAHSCAQQSCSTKIAMLGRTKLFDGEALPSRPSLGRRLMRRSPTMGPAARRVLDAEPLPGLRLA